jgi:Zn-dependent peptidase ImmA (M78 family)/transcriptional regulator with XRE-family HTH domain
MTDALITPKILTWARKRSGLSIPAIASKIGVSVDIFSSWERGDTHPNLRQAQKIAHKMYIPLGYLFLSDPPVEKVPLRDFRKVKGQPQPLSPEFIDVLYDALRKQDWYREHQKLEGAEPASFVGKFNLKDSVKTIAGNIRSTIGINDSMRQRAHNWEDFLADFIHCTEAKGILVLRQGFVGNNTFRKLSVQEFRGFAISDSIAPLVFINDQDAKVAKIFTLAHELAHLWIGESGISNLDYSRRSIEQKNTIDRFCDQIAAETLTPSDHFKSYWGFYPTIEGNINSLVRRYRVSRFVILRRAYDLDLITHEDYQTYYQDFWEDKRSTKQGDGPGFDRLFLYRNSFTFTFALLGSAVEGRVSYVEAARLLNVKMKSLMSIEKRLL